MSKKLILIVSVPLLVGVVIFIAVFFKVQYFNIYLSNIPCTKTSDIEQNFNLKGKNILLVSSENFSANLQKKYLCVKQANLEKKLPNTINVLVEGRAPLLAVASLPKTNVLDLKSLMSTPSSQAALIDWSVPDNSETYFIADETGLVFSKANEANQLPMYYLSDQVLEVGQKIPSQIFQNITQVVNHLNSLEDFPNKNFTGKLVGSNLLLNICKEGTCSLLDSPQKIALSTQSDIKKQLASLQLIIRKAKIDQRVLNMIDLRFDKPVVTYQDAKR